MEKENVNIRQKIIEAIQQALQDMGLTTEDVAAYTGITLQQEDKEMASKHQENYIYIDKMGKQQSVRFYGADRHQTDMKFQRFLAGADHQAITVSEFIDQIFRPSFMPSLSASTKDAYEQFFKYNIVPYLGDMKMSEVTVATIQQFMNWMATGAEHGRKKNINAKSITRICALVRRMFSIAVEMKYVDDNPVKWVLLNNPGETAGHHTAASDRDIDEIKRKIPGLENEQQRLYMALLVYTGLRKEELLGLKWSDLHIDDGYGFVERAVVHVGSARETVIKTPKTHASTRTFIIVQPLADILNGCKKHDGFIIHGEDPTIPACDTRVRKTYERAFQILGIFRKYTNHDFRATFGTQLKENGLTSAEVADLLGHADTRMVETIYARTRHEGVLKKLGAVERLNQKYNKKTTE